MLAGFFCSTVAAVLLLLLVACAEDLMSPGAADQVSDRVHTMARDGDPTAQTALGVIFERGLGVPRDTAKARIWYDRAARQGDPLAEYHIGSLYERGVGVDQDYGEAARWYRRAAEKQHDAAQAALAYLYERGLGVDQDYGRARALYAAAARRWQAEAVFPPEATFALGRERPTTRFSRRSARTQGEEEAVTTDWPPPPPVEVDLAAIADAPARARAAPGDFDGPAPIAGTGEAFPLGINATSAAPIAALPSLKVPRGYGYEEPPVILPEPPRPASLPQPGDQQRLASARAELFDELIYDSRRARSEAAQTVGRVPHRVSLGGHESAAQAIKTWEQLRHAQPTLLGPLTLALKSEPRSDRATRYVIEAGPLPGPDAARLLCTALALQGLACRSDSAFSASAP